MPELPEVETVRRGLDKHIVGRQIESLDFDWPKGFPNAPAEVKSFVIKAKIIGTERRGKALFLHLSTKYSLMIHLKMTGQLVYVGEERFGAGHPDDSLISTLPSKSTRVIIKFTDKTTLYFNDQRKFGWMKLMPTSEIEQVPFIAKLGPEPLEREFTKNVFNVLMRKRNNRGFKAALLDQSVVAGIGNIYADEALFMAKIHPTAKIIEASDEALETLRKAIVDILALSLEKGGSTDRNYVDAEGKKGSYIEFAQVFRREGKECRRCGATIVKTRVAGRGTHTCPVCQNPEEQP